MLQQAWFRIKDIPRDQRLVRTIAKVGGLVGKVMEIDERTRFRADYVRVKIACRDVMKVPKTTEGALGLCLHDFIFEREVQEEESVKKLSTGIIITEKDHQAKRHKAEDQPKQLQLIRPANIGGALSTGGSSSKGGHHQKPIQISQSAPVKMKVFPDEKSRKNVAKQIQVNDKAKKTLENQEQHSKVVEDEEDRVHISDHFEESDAESETLSERLRKIDAYNGENQGTSGGGQENNNQAAWHMEVEVNEEVSAQIMNLKNQDKISSMEQAIHQGVRSMMTLLLVKRIRGWLLRIS